MAYGNDNESMNDINSYCTVQSTPGHQLMEVINELRYKYDIVDAISGTLVFLPP